jgi:dihydropteroate synthase
MGKKVKIMGIINITDNSFYSSSRAITIQEISNRLQTLVSEGADIVDIGACSTKPGSQPVSAEEEWKRLEPALKLFREHYPDIPASIDTFRAPIVQRCFETIGPFLVNDISAGEYDPRMLPLVGKIGLGYVAMHKRGTPETMQNFCQYDNVTLDIVQYFREFDLRASDCGIRNWILDPGFGFSKTMEQNYELLDNLSQFKVLGKEILVGISRKSFIYKKLGISPEDALPATTELHKKAINNGANILRVHDVAAAKSLIEKNLTFAS